MAEADGVSGQEKFESRQFTSLKTAVAIGCMVTVGLSIFLLLGPVYQQSGKQTSAAYGLTIFFFLLLILSVAERAGATSGKGGLYSLPRSSHLLTTSFATGWILFGGILFLTAVFAWEGGLALGRIMATLFEYDLDGRLLSALILLIVLPHLVARSESPWRRRTFLVYSAILVLIILVFAAWRTSLESASSYAYLPSGMLVTSAPLLVVSLWSFQFILDHRDELRRPGRAILPALFLPLLIGAILGAILAWVLIQYTPVLFYDNLPLTTLATQIHPLLALLILLAMLGFAIFGVNESLSSALKLSSAMAHDGYMPRGLSLRGRFYDLPKISLFLLVIGALLITTFASSLVLLAISSACLLLAITLVNTPDIFHSKLRLPEKRWLRMPLHPLVPILAAAISITGILLQPLEALLITTFWLIAGALFFVGYAREGAVRQRQDRDIVSTTTVPLKKTAYRVLAAIVDPAAGPDLIRLGLQIATARGGNLTLLQIIIAQERDQEARRAANAALQGLAQSIAALDSPAGMRILPVVRIAKTAAGGILTTLWEEQTDSVILGWPGPKEHHEEKDETTSRIVRHAQAQVVVLHGKWPESPCRLLVPTVSAKHSAAALSLAQNLAGPEEECGIVAMQVVVGKLSKKAESQARQQLEQTLAKLEDTNRVERQVVGVNHIKEGIIGQSDQYDALLMGLSDAGYLSATRFAGVAVAVASQITPPALLVASQENMVSYWLRRTWDQLTSVIPTLTTRQQTTVSTTMRLNAQVSIDFHVLITLATAIAFLGLIQNSAAVIIGAMLVAPLMNPILSMAHGIVKGRLKMLREAANTTLNGIVIAVTIGVILTLVLLAMGYPLTPTSEILARTQPNFLDLLIAIASGAVAAYAVSRTEVAGALPGVAIAAALVPPLAVVGYGLGTAQFDIASGSLLLFLTNLAAIVLAAAIVFLLLGFRPPARVGRDEQARFGMKIAVISLLIISLPLLVTSRRSGVEASRDSTITDIMQDYWLPNQASVENITITQQHGNALLVQATIFDYDGVVTDESLATLQVTLANATGQPVTLETQIIDARQENFNSSRSAIELALPPTPTPLPTLSLTPTSEVISP